jgi:hypothetical protein
MKNQGMLQDGDNNKKDMLVFQTTPTRRPSTCSGRLMTSRKKCAASRDRFYKTRFGQIFSQILEKVAPNKQDMYSTYYGQ